MYSPLKVLVGRVLKVPTSAPEPPSGSYTSVKVFRASPRYLTYRLLSFYLVCTVLVLALGIGLVATLVAAQIWATLAVTVVGAMIAFFLFLSWFTVRIDYDLRHYIVTDRSLRVREGAMTVKEMTLTYANVQNLRIVQGPLQRLFKISDLAVDTAGGGSPSAHGHTAGAGHNITLAGIEDPHELRDLILSHVKSFSRGSGLGDPDDADARAPFVQPAALSAPAVIEALEKLRSSAAAFRRAAEAG